MLTSLYERGYDKVPLHEADFKMCEETVHTTSIQDVSNITGPLVIETRDGLAESAIYLKEANPLVKFKFALQDGTAPDPTAEVSLSHGAWSLFSKAQLDINQSN